jgi:hypothetical protein
MKFGKASFNPEALVGLNKTEVKAMVKHHNIRPHSIDFVVKELMKAAPKPVKVKQVKAKEEK